MDAKEEENLQNFMSDEEPENQETQKEDMKQYLNKINKKYELLIEALKNADQMMTELSDPKAVMEQINNKKLLKDQKIEGK